MENQGWFQHGDVKITPAVLPGKARKIMPTNGARIVLREGEVTGHAHVIEETMGVELFTMDEVLYLEVEEGQTAIVTHEEHLPATIPPGVWEVGAVEEYDYAAEEMRRVLD